MKGLHSVLGHVPAADPCRDAVVGQWGCDSLPTTYPCGVATTTVRSRKWEGRGFWMAWRLRVSLWRMAASVPVYRGHLSKRERYGAPLLPDHLYVL